MHDRTASPTIGAHNSVNGTGDNEDYVLSHASLEFDSFPQSKIRTTSRTGTYVIMIMVTWSSSGSMPGSAWLLSSDTFSNFLQFGYLVFSCCPTVRTSPCHKAVFFFGCQATCSPHHCLSPCGPHTFVVQSLTTHGRLNGMVGKQVCCGLIYHYGSCCLPQRRRTCAHATSTPPRTHTPQHAHTDSSITSA